MIRRWVLRPITLSVFVFLVIFVLLNSSLFVSMPSDLEQQADIWLQLHQYKQAEKSLRVLANQYPNDLDIQFLYLKSVFSLPEQNWPLAALEARYSTLMVSPQTNLTGQWGKAWMQIYQNNPQAALHNFEKIEALNLKYVNLGMGQAHLMLNQSDLAKQAFIKEMTTQGDWERAVSLLFSMSVRSGQMAYARDILTSTPGAYQVVNPDDLRRMAFSTGDWLLYFEQLLFQPLRSIHYFAIGSSLFIAAIWFFYFWRIDIFEQEPILFSLLVVTVGGMMAILTVPVGDSLRLINSYQMNGNLVNDLIYSITYIGLVEELMKLLPLMLMIRLTKQINEPIDVIIYASLSALGFATVENIVIISRVGEQVMIARLLIATLMHLASTSVFAYVWAMARFVSGRNLKTAAFIGWILAGVVHGVFDFLVLSPSSRLDLAPLLMLVLTVWLYGMMLKNSLNFSPFLKTPTLVSKRLVNYEWILSAGWWVLLMGYGYFYSQFATAAANAWIAANLWTSLPVILGIFAALGELSIKKGEFVFP